MLKNYFKVAIRTLLRSRVYSFINILGLSIGISGATLLLIYVNDELSFDAFHRDADRIYRIVTEDKTAEVSRLYGETFTLLAKTLEEELPEVEDQVTLYQTRNQINFRLNGKRITEENWWMVDDNFFRFFDFELIEGNPETVLSEPNSIVLSESLARKYFGDKDPIGKTINEFEWGDFQVTGIVKDVPSNSHIQFDLVVGVNFTAESEWRENLNTWEQPRAYSYLKLLPESNGDELETKMSEFLDKYRGPGSSEDYELDIQALRDIHFGSASIEQGVERFAKGDKSYVLVFTSIALFLLLIAAVNYTNLATSKALFRAKEIGVRKVVGAQKKQLALQFFLESLVITFVATIISVGIIDLVIPYYNQITNKDFEFGLSVLSQYAPMLVTIALLSGLMAGLYPAIFITRFKPVKVLKGEQGIAQGKLSFRKTLVILQFAMSIVMIVAMLVVSNQMQFIKRSDVGFNTEGILVVDINSFYTRRDFRLMKEQFNAIPGVESVSVASRVPGEWKTLTELYIRKGTSNESPDSLRSFYMGFDADVQRTFGFDIVEGNYFSGNDQSDSTKILLNQVAARALGLENPIGAQIKLHRTATRRLDATVIGIVDDFNYQSFHSSVAPLVIGAWNSGLRSIDYFALKLNTNNVANIIDRLTEVHNEFDPATTIEYNFLDTQLEMKYEKEQTANEIFQLGAGLSILVACLGLFGLAAFTVQKRAKELGIRKVLGASEWNIFFLLSSSFVKQVIVGFLIASPAAYLLMANWLNNFSYKTNLGPVTFLIAGGFALLIALVTVSHRSIQAAYSNPVDSLRSE